MYKGKRIGIVVPAYDEEPHIGKVLADMPDFVDAVYVVDDASRDRTADIVRAFATHDGRVCPLSHAVNRGPGAALSTGYARAMSDGMGIVVKVDGDNQMDLLELPRLLDPIADGCADLAKGDRTSRREHLVGMSRWRRCGNRVLCRLTRLAVGNHHVRDTQNGYTAISSDALRIIGWHLYPYYGYLNQMLAWAHAHRLRVVDVPMPSRYLGERSKIRYSAYIPRVSWLLLRLLVGRLWVRQVEPVASRGAAHAVAVDYSSSTAAYARQP